MARPMTSASIGSRVVDEWIEQIANSSGTTAGTWLGSKSARGRAFLEAIAGDPRKRVLFKAVLATVAGAAQVPPLLEGLMTRWGVSPTITQDMLDEFVRGLGNARTSRPGEGESTKLTFAQAFGKLMPVSQKLVMHFIREVRAMPETTDAQKAEKVQAKKVLAVSQGFDDLRFIAYSVNDQLRVVGAVLDPDIILEDLAILHEAELAPTPTAKGVIDAALKGVDNFMVSMLGPHTAGPPPPPPPPAPPTPGRASYGGGRKKSFG